MSCFFYLTGCKGFLRRFSVFGFLPLCSVLHLHTMDCIYCGNRCIKKGWSGNNHKTCQRYQQLHYQRMRYADAGIEPPLQRLHNEGMGINAIARCLLVSSSTIVRRIRKIAAQTSLLPLCETGQVYEMDEMRTYVQCKRQECWIMYAINRSTGAVAGFVTGKRNKDNIGQLVRQILLLRPHRIYTDGLALYPSLIPPDIHRVAGRCTNAIERYNLTLRTHLRRLNRKTICFSKSGDMLGAALQVYFMAHNQNRAG